MQDWPALMIRESVARFADDQVAPRAEQIDRDGNIPPELWTGMGELGLHGITVEEEFGGLGLGYLEHVIAVEEISRVRRMGAGASPLAAGESPLKAARSH